MSGAPGAGGAPPAGQQGAGLFQFMPGARAGLNRHVFIAGGCVMPPASCVLPRLAYSLASSIVVYVLQRSCVCRRGCTPNITVYNLTVHGPAARRNRAPLACMRVVWAPVVVGHWLHACLAARLSQSSAGREGRRRIAVHADGDAAAGAQRAASWSKWIFYGGASCIAGRANTSQVACHRVWDTCLLRV